jgi:hypothetical protein
MFRWAASNEPSNRACRPEALWLLRNNAVAVNALFLGFETEVWALSPLKAEGLPWLQAFLERYRKVGAQLADASLVYLAEPPVYAARVPVSGGLRGRPEGKQALQTETYYQGFVGEGAVFEGKEGIRIAEITDGTSNTLLMVDGGEPVPWTKPQDLPFDPRKPLPKLGGLFPEIFYAALCDGSVQGLKKKLDEQTLRALITRNGGEVIDMSKVEERAFG